MPEVEKELFGDKGMEMGATCMDGTLGWMLGPLSNDRISRDSPSERAAILRRDGTIGQKISSRLG